MPTILVANTVMVELVFVQYAQRMENVFHVLCPGAPTDADLLAIKNVFQLWDRTATPTSTNLCAQRSSQCSLVQITLTSLHSVGGPMLEFPLPANSAGTLGGAYPTFVTVAVKWVTGQQGRAKRGRSYHCGIAYGQGTDGLMSAANATSIQNCYTRLLTEMSAAGYTLVVATKYFGVEIVNGHRRGIPRAAGAVTPITFCGVERGLDTMRKRKIPHIA